MSVCRERDCNIGFAQQFQYLLQDVDFLACTSGQAINVSGTDELVKVSPDDPCSGYLGDKIEGVSGIILTEVQSDPIDGYPCEKLQVSLDLDFLDDRYINQTENVLTFELNAGVINACARFNKINKCIQSLTFKDSKPSSSWNYKIPKNFFPGETNICLRWTTEKGVSGISIFEVEYNSVSVGETISLSQSQIVSGISDGVALKMYETCIDVTSGLVMENDTFLLKVTRRGDLSEDTLKGPIEILGVSLDYRQY